jgi:hypothetical protein
MNDVVVLSHASMCGFCSLAASRFHDCCGISRIVSIGITHLQAPTTSRSAALLLLVSRELRNMLCKHPLLSIISSRSSLLNGC